MNKIAALLGLKSVEGKQSIYGSRTGTDWEIDGKGVKVGGESFVIIECRCYSKQKQKQE
jgi:Restriction endonuclease